MADERKELGRNEPCPCESGKKFKRCCLLRKRPAFRWQFRLIAGVWCVLCIVLAIAQKDPAFLAAAVLGSIVALAVGYRAKRVGVFTPEDAAQAVVYGWAAATEKAYIGRFYGGR